MIDSVAELLRLHEGYRAKPYHCTAGKLTIGIGRNLDDVGIDEDEASYLLSRDIERACWCMVVMASRHKRLHRDMRDHYRDGMRLGWQRLREGRQAFGQIWGTWELVREPANSL